MSDTPQPASFADFKLNKQLLTAVAEAGFTEPTPVQVQTIPLLLAGHDVLGIAQTGTGKTAAFGLPLLMKVKYAQGTNPRALIMAPTRELAMQIETHLKRLATYTDLRIFAIYGGLGPKTQIETIAKGVDILIATPGRLLELYLRGDLVLKELKTLVLDEADKMMDMGFMPQIRKILEVIPNKRQNALFSATMADKVTTLSEEFLEFPMRVEVTPSATSAQNVVQSLYEVPNLVTKINLLGYLLRDQATFNRVMIFTRSKVHAENVAHFLGRRIAGEVRAIHGNKGQNSRINAMEAFKAGEVRFLVATDVAARGIDVPEVSHVINFDVPLIYDDYVHRIGRTGRAQHTGAAITFANEAEMHHIAQIEELIKQPIPLMPFPAEVEVAETPFEEQQSMNREQDERRRREDPNFKGAFHERKEYVKPGVTIDKRTGRTYVEGPNRSQKGNKARPSKGSASKPAVKAVKAAIARSKGRRK
ncbi:DEAD/DEAH box helicase [Hymenobacter sp. BT186]|uniref:DEAD/DEAH box helicase n=1 Tax=Hymenobacter telluris TaxID=2816474 RepID=A0A939EYF9_9BACT|nr:DEAD/DEAH box helicase [Hymenobacter telluris]MBO0359820.1 DEAD/DEAH box helicase [Hymenobacter telluris]MBW3375847.1 DEAD/DEAH box helicase [Hymenobacter norwichensis]